MTNAPNDDSKRRAETLVPPTSEGADQAATESRQNLVTAVSEDLQSHADHAAVDEARLAKVEAQTRGLAEAVIAIANPQVTVASVQAVKEEMSALPSDVRDRITE